jgi:hypothetical protein
VQAIKRAASREVDGEAHDRERMCGTSAQERSHRTECRQFTSSQARRALAEWFDVGRGSVEPVARGGAQEVLVQACSSKDESCSSPAC